MVAIKAADAEAYVARPDPARPIALVFGPDAGLVSERAGALVRAAVDDLNDPFALVRLDGDGLAADPARLVDEAGTIPLFGGRRAIWIKAGGRDFSAAVGALLARPVGDCRVVIEAGDLRRNAALRVLCERAGAVAAIACYADGERDLVRLIDEEMRAANLPISPDARAALIPLLGGDRRASRNELRKLTLYAHGKERIEIDDVAAVVADASALLLDNLVDAMFAGRAAEVETSFARAQEAGIAPGRIVSTALFQVGQLHRARLEVENGASIQVAAEQLTGKAQFRRKPAIEAALKAWTAARLERAMAQLAEAAFDARRLTGPAAALGDPAISRTLLAVAQAARQRPMVRGLVRG
jgi:DNA polymerase-3 subunit delta